MGRVSKVPKSKCTAGELDERHDGYVTGTTSTACFVRGEKLSQKATQPREAEAAIDYEAAYRDLVAGMVNRWRF